MKLVCAPCSNTRGSSTYIKSFLRKGQARDTPLLPPACCSPQLSHPPIQNPPRITPLTPPPPPNTHARTSAPVLLWRQALLALGRPREAAAALEAGLTADPLNPDLKLALQAAEAGVLKVGAAGVGGCSPGGLALCAYCGSPSGDASLC